MDKEKEKEKAREQLFELVPEFKEYVDEKGKAEFKTEEEKIKEERLEKVKNTKATIPGTNRDSFLRHDYKGYDLINKGNCLGDDFNEVEKELIAKWVIDAVIAKRSQPGGVKTVLTDYIKSVEKTTMVEGTGSLGGYGVFDKFDTKLWGLVAYATPILGLADTQTIDGKTMKIAVEDASVTARFASEAAAFQESNPTLSQITMNLHKLGFYTNATQELLEDFQWNFVDWLLMRGAEAFARKIESEVFVGPTFNSFRSNNASIANVSVASLSALSYTHFSEAIGKLEPQLKAKAKWYINYGVMHYVRTIKDTTNRPIFTEGFDKTVPGKIYGIPVQEVVGMPGSDATSLDNIAILADMKNYKILRRKNDLDLIVDPYSSAINWITRFVLGTRIDGALILPGACARISLT